MPGRCPCEPLQYDTGSMIPEFPIDKRSLLSRLGHEVHVWLLQPEKVVDAAVLAAYADSLSGAEHARQQRFHFEHDRKLFLVAHGMLRSVLSRYVAVAPSQWQFSSGRYGRPAISGPDGLPALRFNLSHTRGLVACAVSLEFDCGVDVERLRTPRNPRRGRIPDPRCPHRDTWESRNAGRAPAPDSVRRAADRHPPSARGCRS